MTKSTAAFDAKLAEVKSRYTLNLAAPPKLDGRSGPRAGAEYQEFMERQARVIKKLDAIDRAVARRELAEERAAAGMRPPAPKPAPKPAPAGRAKPTAPISLADALAALGASS